MNLLFAQWIFTIAATLPAGTDLQFPAMAAQRLAPPTITEQILHDDVWVPGTICQSGDPTCVPSPGGFTGGNRYQHFCLAPGVYVAIFRLGLMPGPATTGRIWLHGPGGVTHLLAYRSAPDEWPTWSTSTAIAADLDGCWSLRYDGLGAVTVNPDPATTRLTIHRAG